jgi:DNA-directed RNA polymerase subunit RPC12/RpoP
MADREVYGGLLIIVGFGLAISYVWLRNLDLMWVGLAIFTVGLLLVPTEEKSWYCAACGQYLGKGDVTSKCERCGSNRVTDEDPGAGEVVRVKSSR